MIAQKPGGVIAQSGHLHLQTAAFLFSKHNHVLSITSHQLATISVPQPRTPRNVETGDAKNETVQNLSPRVVYK